MTDSTECYHQSKTMCDEFEDEKGEIVYEDFEVCRDCGMVILNGKEMGIPK